MSATRQIAAIVLALGANWPCGPAAAQSGNGALRNVALRSRLTHVQPMTGIVLWTSNEQVAESPIQLEFRYFTYAQVVQGPGDYDWSILDRQLEQTAARGHQLVLRWHDTYVGKPTGVPKHVVELPGYRHQTAKSEGRETGFPDWGHPALQQCVLDFLTAFAERYDRDRRLAFVELGFGLWGEYHLYDGPMELGRTFPSLEFQAKFLRHADKELRVTPWMISIDAADDWSPVTRDPDLLSLRLGLFDDSLNHRHHKSENLPDWNAMGRDRWRVSPAGGEFSFYQRVDQTRALAPEGPHGVSFESHAAEFHLSFVLGDGQPKYQPAERILQAGQALGYRFAVTEFRSGPGRSRVRIENRGIAPLYYDAYPAIDGVRSDHSLRGLLPGEQREFSITAGGDQPRLTIECSRLVPGQMIEYEADLP